MARRSPKAGGRSAGTPRSIGDVGMFVSHPQRRWLAAVPKPAAGARARRGSIGGGECLLATQSGDGPPQSKKSLKRLLFGAVDDFLLEFGGEVDEVVGVAGDADDEVAVFFGVGERV